jgi:hypothetical protein
MTDKLEQDRIRGERAERLLSDELLNESFATLEDEYISAWKMWPAHDTNGRERIWMAVQVLGKVKGNLQSVARSGRIAKREIDDTAGKRKSIFRVVG